MQHLELVSQHFIDKHRWPTNYNGDSAEYAPEAWTTRAYQFSDGFRQPMVGLVYLGPWSIPMLYACKHCQRWLFRSINLERIIMV